MAGLGPFWITSWRVGPPFLGLEALRWLGWMLLLASALPLLDAFVRFAWQGLGTPAPIAAPTRLVVSGPYRYVRNPMYVGVFGAILGQALLLGQPALLVYAGFVWLGFHFFVLAYEEPTLRSRFPHDYAESLRRAAMATQVDPMAWRPSVGLGSSSRSAPILRVDPSLPFACGSGRRHNRTLAALLELDIPQPTRAVREGLLRRHCRG